MNYKKIETTVNPDGKVSKRELETVAADRFEANKEWERERASNLAKSRLGTSRIETVEETDYNIITIYVSGKVKILAYVPEDK